MGQDDQEKERPEPDRGHHEEVDGDQAAGVVIEERSQSGGGRLAASEHVLVDRRLGHDDAPLIQFPEDSWCSLGRIGS